MTTIKDLFSHQPQGLERTGGKMCHRKSEFAYSSASSEGQTEDTKEDRTYKDSEMDFAK